MPPLALSQCSLPSCLGSDWPVSLLVWPLRNSILGNRT